jgi:thioredoxin-related protein
MKDAGTKHPHFKSDLRWFTTLADALVRARAEKKKVFIEYGREACGNCRDLVENVLPLEDVRRVLDAGFVPVAIDCDAPDPAVRALGAAHMSHARSLPFVIYTDAEGRFLHGTQGGRSSKELLLDLDLVNKKAPG